MSEAKMSTETRQRLYKRRIRNIIIHRPMQREFVFVIIALLMVSTLAIGVVIHATIREAAFGGGFRFGKISPYEILSDVSYQLVVRVAGVLFLTLLVICSFGIFFLYRVAGPVYRFRQVFMRLNDGEMPPPIKLREGDFFHEIANEINEVLKKMGDEREKTKELKQKLDQALALRPPENVARLIREAGETLGRRPKEG